jgi:hypothetical protein
MVPIQVKIDENFILTKIITVKYYIPAIKLHMRAKANIKPPSASFPKDDIDLAPEVGEGPEAGMAVGVIVNNVDAFFTIESALCINSEYFWAFALPYY